MKNPLVITNHLSGTRGHKPTHSCKYTHPLIRKQSSAPHEGVQSHVHERRGGQLSKRWISNVSDLFVPCLWYTQPVGYEQNCLFLVLAFTHCLFLLNSVIAAQQRYYGLHYSLSLRRMEPMSPYVFRY